MVDVVSRATRRRMMAGIRGANTRPELLIRHGLYARGFRYRLHAKHLPGRPDLVLPHWGSAIFIHGCFWHRHGDDCPLFKWPSTRTAWWREKLDGNHERDARKRRELIDDGWWVLTLWECALKGPTRRPIDQLLDRIEQWLRHERRHLELRGRRVT
ncbi:MAG: very short patch repair endonuclease [Planctomycetota bacterium]